MYVQSMVMSKKFSYIGTCIGTSDNILFCLVVSDCSVQDTIGVHKFILLHIFI